jgi:hypothetical protein
MSLAIKASTPATLPAPRHSTHTPTVANRPFNTDGQLYAYGEGIALGRLSVFVDALGGMQLNIGNARLLDGKNSVLVWNHSGKKSNAIELPVRPSWVNRNDARNMSVDTYLTPDDVRRLGLKPGSKLALQPKESATPGQKEPVTLVPVFSEKQVFPGRIG